MCYVGIHMAFMKGGYRGLMQGTAQDSCTID